MLAAGSCFHFSSPITVIRMVLIPNLFLTELHEETDGDILSGIGCNPSKPFTGLQIKAIVSYQLNFLQCSAHFLSIFPQKT